jgi:transposase
MTQNRMLTMSTKEIERCEILKMVEEKKITQKAGARKIAVSERQFRRLLSKYRRDGPQGMISGHRCKPSNNRMLPEKREAIIEKLRTEYADFGATLASEKLGEREGIEVSKETVRQIMIQEGLHQPKKRKEEKVRQMRERRKHRGELVQIDGSYHAWLEDRAGKACLILFVDDATSEILAGEFVEHESFFAYARVCKHYFQHYGLPEAFYSDRHGIFRVNHPNTTTTEDLTQFGRVMTELGIETLCAYSPQAKGRVERANQTLQDRLVKEMRLAGVISYAQANVFLLDYIPVYNQRFAVQPRSPLDSHEPLLQENKIDAILSKQFPRKLSKDLQIQYQKVIYQIATDRPAYALKERTVTVCESEAGTVSILLNGSLLEYKVFHRQPKQAAVVTSKEVNRTSKPAPDHPWRRYGHNLADQRIQTSY